MRKVTTPTGPPLVGRDHVLAALDNAAGAAASGCGGLVVVAGHPGMGKSRLLAEFAARTTARGFAVLRGAGTDDAGAPALRPWTTVLRSAAAGRDAGTLRTVWGTAAVPGFRLLPELAAPDGPPVQYGPPEVCACPYGGADA